MGFSTILPTQETTHRKVLQENAPHELWLDLYQNSRAVFCCQALLKLLLDPDFLSLLGQVTQSSVTFSQTESSPAILLFCLSFSIVLSKLVRIWHVTSSLLSSGSLVKGIICHVAIWNRSVLLLLVLGHPLY